MLDKIIHTHLDAMEAIEDNLEADLEAIISKIDVEMAMELPEIEMQGVAQDIEDMLIDKYFEQAVKEGKKFAQAVRKSKEIIVPDTTDPKLNEALASDKHQD